MDTAIWMPASDARAFDCGAFLLDHEKSEFEMADLEFGHQSSAFVVVATNPVLREAHWKAYEHGWNYHFFVRFSSTNWNEQRFHGSGKTVDMAKDMGVNLACAAYATYRNIKTPAIEAGQIAALRGEVKMMRHAQRMVRYVLKDFPAAMDRAKYYLKVPKQKTQLALPSGLENK